MPGNSGQDPGQLSTERRTWVPVIAMAVIVLAVLYLLALLVV